MARVLPHAAAVFCIPSSQKTKTKTIHQKQSQRRNKECHSKATNDYWGPIHIQPGSAGTVWLHLKDGPTLPTACPLCAWHVSRVPAWVQPIGAENGPTGCRIP